MKRAITINNQEIGKRHTYFFNPSTRVSSQGNPLEFDDLKPGHAVLLDFIRTDSGRALNFIRIPELDNLVDIEPIEVSEDLFISGVATGVRATKRTITIRGSRLTQSLTLHVPESVDITNKSKVVKLSSIKVGDAVEFRHHETQEGFVILCGEVTRKSK